MSAVSYAALGISIISLVVSLYVLFLIYPRKQQEEKTHTTQQLPQMSDPGKSLDKPNMPKKPSPDFQIQPVLEQIQKFSSMVSKNLEQLNTKVGVKSNVRPIDITSSNTNRKESPSVVDSEVSDEQQ